VEWRYEGFDSDSHIACAKNHQLSAKVKAIALQNALRYNFALLSPARFSETDGENSLPANTVSKKLFGQEYNFSTG